jgi:hypothetical protein
MKHKTIRHTGVPYYSQWGSPEWVQSIVEEDADPCDDPAWQRSGFTEQEHYRFWAQRLCGLTCLESALDFWGIEHAPRATLLDEALHHEVYRMREDGGVDGLIYRPFASWAEQAFGLQVEVLPEAGGDCCAHRQRDAGDHFGEPGNPPSARAERTARRPSDPAAWARSGRRLVSQSVRHRAVPKRCLHAVRYGRALLRRPRFDADSPCQPPGGLNDATPWVASRVRFLLRGQMGSGRIRC